MPLLSLISQKKNISLIKVIYFRAVGELDWNKQAGRGWWNVLLQLITNPETACNFKKE
jgi:hypothetical protein